MSNAVLVTGAGGFIGAALCRHLAAQGKRVIGIVRRPAAGLGAGIEQHVVADIGPETDWQSALRGVDTVVHAAARVHIGRDPSSDPLEAFRRVNTYGTKRLAEACSEAGVSRFIYLSSIKALGDRRADGRPYQDDDPPAPTDAYGKSKAEAEELIRELPLAATILRPPLVYGPGVRGNFLMLLKACDSHWPLPVGGIGNRRSLLALDNLVRAIATAIDHPAAAGRTFNLRDGEDLSTTELVRRMRRALGRLERIWPAPRALLQGLSRLPGLAGPIERMTGSLAVDDRGIRQALGWSPPLGVDQGLAQVAAWYRSRRGASAATPVL